MPLAAWLALLGPLNRNLQPTRFNHSNLGVYPSIARLCRQNLEMPRELQHINSLLNSAEHAAARADAKRAVGSVDRALEIAGEIRQQQKEVLSDTVKMWYKSWFPCVAEAKGRRYLLEVEDVKDPLPMRTVGMSYLVYRELILPLGKW